MDLEADFYIETLLNMMENLKTMAYTICYWLAVKRDFLSLCDKLSVCAPGYIPEPAHRGERNRKKIFHLPQVIATDDSRGNNR
jgi:hypothetical protein